MNALELMRRLREMPDEEKRIREHIDMCRDAAMQITARYGQQEAGGSGESDKMAAHAARVEKYQRQLDALKIDWQWQLGACVRISERIDEDVQRKILYHYYAKCWTLSAIAVSLGYSEGYIRKRKQQLDKTLSEMDAAAYVPPQYEKEFGNDRNT